MRDTPRMDIFAACCVQCLLSHWRRFFLVQESKIAWQKRCIYLFPQNVPNTLPAWVSWAVVSSFSQLQEDTHRHTLNHVAAKWQQTHICILFKGRMCIYIFICLIFHMYTYIYIRRRNHILYICLRGAENFRTWHEVSFCTNFVQGVEDCGELFSLLCTFKEVLSRCCHGFEDSALGYFMLFICLCNNSCTGV